VSIKQHLMDLAEPTVLRYYRWRGDPLARWIAPKTKGDPYPLYTDLRQPGLVRSALGPVLTTRHATAESILRDRRFSSSPVHQSGYQPPAGPADGADEWADGLAGPDLLTLDPPAHTRLRRLVSGAFTPKAVASLEPWIRETAGRLLEEAGANGEFDLIGSFALPLPIAVICRLLGVPPQDQVKFRAWSNDVAASVEPQTNRAAARRSRDSELALVAYLRELVARHRAEPDDSILSALVAAEDEGDRLSSRELVATALLLLVAGFETTVNLIGNGTVALLNERAQWDRLTREPNLVPGAVEELLRYDSPVQLTSRTATEDVTVDGTLVTKGTSVIVGIGGANRDPAVFDQPDELRIDRPDAARHLAFSRGIHACLGPSLARLEGRIAFEELTQRYPGLALAGTPARRPRLVLRGYESVPLRMAGPGLR
jgi:cytochrome P450